MGNTVRTEAYKPEKWMQLSEPSGDNHEVILYLQTNSRDIVTAANTKPTTESDSGYGGYGGYGGGYGGYAVYASYAYLEIEESYESKTKNQEGQDLRVSFTQRDLSETWELKPASEFRSPKTLLLFVNQQDPAFMTKLFDSALPSWTRAVENGLISFVLVYDKSDTSEDFVVKVANWIGATAIISTKVSSLGEHSDAKKFLDSIAKQVVTVKHKYVPEVINEHDLLIARFSPEIINRFKLIEAVRYLPLDDVKKLEENDKSSFEVVDPIGNSLLQLALHNQNTDVFFYLARKYPKQLNLPNMFNRTPLSSITWMKDRLYNTKYFDWKVFWTLPFDFSSKVSEFEWLDFTELPILVLELMRNKEVWSKAKEHISDRQERLAKTLVKIPLTFRSKNRTDEEAFEVLKLFVAEGVTIDSEAIYWFAGCGFLECVKYFVEKGYKITTRDYEHAFNNGWKETMDYLLDLPEFMYLHKDTKDKLIGHLASDSRGFSALLRKVSKKGVPLPLSAAQGARLSTANIIAQANAKKVIPLKHLCVHALYDVHGEKNIHTAIANTPEDIRNLFLNQNRYQWVLYLDNEQKQRQLLKLYEALSRADREGDAMQVTIDGFMFSFQFLNQFSKDSVEMWCDGLSKKAANPNYKYFRYDWSEITSSMHVDEHTETDEKHKEVLAKIMDGIGWDHSDAYVLITVLHAHMNGRNAEGEDVIRCESFVQQPVAANFHPIPDWYKTFIAEHYGIEVAPKP